MAEAVAVDRTLPHNLEAERSVLGAVLIHNDAFNQAAEVLTPRDFYRDAHRRIFYSWTALVSVVGLWQRHDERSGRPRQ